tara:strand:- start:58110 stop:60809 length:2700 start_codon:yes stop_codon:yes gene_type:complete
VVDFKIRVVIDPSRAKGGAKVVRSELDKTTAKANNLGSALKRALGFLGAGLLARSATKTLANFSQEMSTVGAVTNATAEEFAMLEERAIQLGTTTRFTATQAAEGMTFLARAGFDAGQAFEAVDDTLRLAQAGALDLGRAADIASNVLTGFRLNVADAGEVVDVMALAANSANTTVEQLGQALSFAAPVAAGMGVSVQDATAAIEALSNAGLQGSRAGTGLTRVMAVMEQGNAKLAKALEGTGFGLDDIKVTTNGLIPAMKRLASAGIDTGTALEIFGLRGGPAFEVLSSSVDDVEKFALQLEGAGGTAERVAAAMDDNLNGALLATKSAFEGLILRLGQRGATGALRKFLDILSSGLRLAADNIDKFINVIQGLAFVLGVTLARRAIGSVITSLKALGVALLTNPIGLFASAVTLAVGALIAFQDEITLSKDSTTTFGDVLKATIDAGKKLFEEIGGVVEELAKTIDGALGTSLGGFELSLQNGILAAASFADATVGILLALGNSLIALFSGIPRAIGSAIFVVLQKINNFIEGTIDISAALFNSVGATAKILGLGLLNFFRDIDLALTQLAQGQLSAAKQTASQAKDVLTGQLAGVGTTFIRKFKAEVTAGELDRTIEEIVNPFEGAGGDMAAAMTKGFEEGLNFSGASDFVLTVLTAADANAAAAAAAESLAAAQTKANEAMAAAVPVAAELATGTSDAAVATEELSRTTGQGLSDGLKTAVKGLTDVSGAAESLVVNAFGSAEDALVSFITTGEADFSAFVDGVLEDITRLLVKQALLAALGGGGGGGGGLLGSLFGGGKAEGGPVNGNQAFLVGEEGPELFVPPGSGNIMTAAETAGAAGGGGGGGNTVVQAPPVNVSVVNVTDPSEVVSALSSPEGEQMVLNIISKNPSVVNQ